jgi:GxxExxY protein
MKTNELNQLTGSVIGAAIEVHREVGPGLLESLYQRCLEAELRRMGISFLSQVPVPVNYKNEVIEESAYRLDLLVKDTVIVEIKSVDEMKPVYAKQLLTYLRLAGKPVGLLINFNTDFLRDGIERVVARDLSTLEQVKNG